MARPVETQADTYLRSGSNELKILEYTAGGDTFGINILKVSRVLADMPSFAVMPNMHPAIRGVFNDLGHVIPVIDLGYFLGGARIDLSARYRVIVTEFFGAMNAFLVDNVEAVHTFTWEAVKDAHNVLQGEQNPYVISIVQPTEDRMILLLDYETIILELSPQQKSTAVKQGESVEYDGGGHKLLVAEDSSSVREMLQLELEEHRFEVIAARDGAEAVSLLAQHPDIALVVSDVEMPQLDGLSLTRHIKETPATAHIPVIVYSSIGDRGMKERARYLKAEEHITKLNMDELIRKIGALLSPAANRP